MLGADQEGMFLEGTRVEDGSGTRTSKAERRLEGSGDKQEGCLQLCKGYLDCP